MIDLKIPACRDFFILIKPEMFIYINLNHSNPHVIASEVGFVLWRCGEAISSKDFVT